MLKTMLDDERISYQGLMEKILEDKGQVPIALTLALIRVFLNIPCVMHKPYIKTKGSRSAKRTFAMKHWYPKKEDKHSKSQSYMLHFAFNGIDTVVPCLPTPVAELKKSITNLKETFNEASDLCQEIFKMVPKSDMKKCYKLIMKSISTAGTLVRSTCTLNGHADMAQVISPQAAVVPVSSHVPSRGRNPPSEKQKPTATVTSAGATVEGGEEQEVSADVHATQEGATVSATGTSGPSPKKQAFMYKFECPCGLQFEDRLKLDKHINSEHVRTGVWRCSKCTFSYEKRSVMFKHFRNKHDKSRLHNWCNIGNCEYGHDNLGYIKKHKEEVHNIKSDIRCGKTFAQKNMLRAHEAICGHPAKPFPCSECDKAYRSKRYMEHHMKMKHPAPGQDVPNFVKSWTAVQDMSQTFLNRHMRDKHG